MVERLFLRLYSRNLGRAWRNDPGDAWGDAKFSLQILIGMPLAMGLAAIWLIGTDLSPKSLGKLGMPTGAMMALVIILWGAMEILFRFKFLKYKDESISSAGFTASSDKVKNIVIASNHPPA